MTPASREIAGGLIMVMIGGFFAIYALVQLPLGTVARMGPGMYPMGIGSLLVLIGLAIAIRGWLSNVSPGEAINVKAAAWILASISAFGLLVRPFGLVVALVVLVLVAARADRSLPLWKVALLAGGIATAAVLIFIVGLGLRFPVFVWPPDL